MRAPHFRGHRHTHQPGPRRRRREPGSGSNGLERRSDRLESGLRLLVMAVLVVGLPMVGWIAGSTSYGHYSQLRAAQLAARHPVRAQLVSDAQVGGDRFTGQTRRWAPVRWNDRQGAHVAEASVEVWQHKGSTATVWLDARGNVTSPPVTQDRAAAVGVVVGLATAIGVAAIVGGAWKSVRVSLDRCRSARWDREWELVEPSWSGRHGR